MILTPPFVRAQYAGLALRPGGANLRAVHGRGRDQLPRALQVQAKAREARRGPGQNRALHGQDQEHG